MSKVRWPIEIPHLLLLASMFAVAAAVWPSLPSRLPVHWTGLPPAIPMRVDGYGGKVQALLTWPLIAAALYLLLLFAPQWSDDYADSQGTIGYGLIRMSMTAFLAVEFFGFVLYYKGYPVNLDSVDRISLMVFGSVWLGYFIWGLIRPHLLS
jgi:hypothetical protein